MTSIYVFGIIPSACPPALEAIGQEFLRGLKLARIDAGPLACVVAPVPDAMFKLLEEILADPTQAPDLLVAHDRVVRSIFAQTTILPCRFGTVLRDRKAVRAWLVGQNDALSARLSVLSDTAEWTIALTAGDRVDPCLEQVDRLDDPAAEPCEGGTRSGGGVLRDKLARRHARRQRRLDRQQTIESLHEAIGSLALEYSLKDPSQRRPEDAFCGSYLVRRADCECLGSLITKFEQGAAGIGLGVRTLGPLPPYSFSHVSTEPARRS